MPRIIKLIVCAWLILFFSSQSFAEESRKFVRIDDIIGPCSGQCSLSAFTGIYSITGLGAFATIDGVTNSRWGGGGIVGVSASRRLVRLGNHFQIEGEVGLARRFGNLGSPEIWTAFVFRVYGFPWDKYIITTLATTTGLNFAFKDDALELARFGNGGRSAKLLHYLAPEITFALPKYPDKVLYFRFHHRSGAARFVKNGVGIFRGAFEGADYGTVGLRVKF